MNMKTTFPGPFRLILLGAFLSWVVQSTSAQSTNREAPLEVKAVHPHRGEIYRHINLPGEVHPLLQVTLFAKVDGYLATLTVDKGDPVKKGDLIADIEVPELKAKRVKYKAEVELAQAEFQQISESPANNPVSGSASEMRAAKNRIALALGQLGIARANLEYTETMLNYARVTAPFDGIITKRFVDPGAYIPVPNAADTPEAAAIVNVTDFKMVRMQVAVPENEVRHIKLNQPVRWTTDALPGEIFDGTITRTYWALDRATKTMLIEVEMTNRDMMLRPGMLVNARIGLEKKDDALLLPLAALVKEKVNSFVFLAANGVAKKLPVKTGFNDGTNVEIVSGLKPEDLVILVRQQALRDAQPVKVFEGKEEPSD
jgi:membrane fusion protein (multidrug efflux system)